MDPNGARSHISVLFALSFLLTLLLSMNLSVNADRRYRRRRADEETGRLFSNNHTNSLIKAVLDSDVNGANSSFLEDDELDKFDSNHTEEVNLGIDTSVIDINEGIELLKNASSLDDVHGKEDASASYVEGKHVLLLLNRTHYDNRTHPTNDDIFKANGLKTTVFVGLQILSLDNFDTRAMEYTMDINLRMTWRDIRLQHNYTAPLLLKFYKDFIERIWRPDPYFINSKESKFHKVTFPNFRMVIKQDGTVLYNMRILLKPACQMVFCKYPHDKHVCDLMISSIAYPKEEVEFVWFTEKAVKRPSGVMPELQLQKIQTDTCKQSRLVDASCLRMALDLKRNPGRFWMEKYFPSTVAMMFSWVAPYVPYHYDEIRIITPITVLLTLVQMQRGDEAIPRVSYNTALDTWFSVLKVFTVGSLLESLIALGFVKAARKLEKQSKYEPLQSDKEKLLLQAKKKSFYYTFTDNVAKILTPLLFTLWTLYYFVFVARGVQDSCLDARADARHTDL